MTAGETKGPTQECNKCYNIGLETQLLLLNRLFANGSVLICVLHAFTNIFGIPLWRIDPGDCLFYKKTISLLLFCTSYIIFYGWIKRLNCKRACLYITNRCSSLSFRELNITLMSSLHLCCNPCLYSSGLITGFQLQQAAMFLWKSCKKFKTCPSPKRNSNYYWTFGSQWAIYFPQELAETIDFIKMGTWELPKYAAKKIYITSWSPTGGEL